MRKYFTWRCIALHVLILVLVPTFFLLGRWQYHAARSGNTLSWAYTFEWPMFGIYAIYVWWQLIHQQSTAWARLWAAKQRTAAAAAGVPIEEIPGWALDKALAAAVTQASLDAPGQAALSGSTLIAALESESGTSADSHQATSAPADEGQAEASAAGKDNVVDARVVDIKVTVDEELSEYNRYLADLSRRDPPKRW